MAKCEATRNQQNISHVAREIAYELDVQSALNRVIGHPESYMPFHESKNKRILDIALLKHKKLYERLYNHLMEAGRSTAFLANPIDKMDSLEEYIGFYLGIPPVKELLFNDPRRVIAVTKEINRMLDKTNDDKIIGKWDKAFTPIILFGWKHDKFGILSKYLKSAATLTENYRTTASPFEARSTQITTELYKHIGDIVAQKTKNMEIPESMTMGGFMVRTTEDDVLGGKKKIHYIATVKDKDGVPKHMVRNEDGTYSLIDREKIDNEEILKGFKRKYYELFDDLMNGQTRKVLWKDELEKEDKERLLHILKESRVRAENQENNPYIHSITLGDTEYRYVMIKPNEAQNAYRSEEIYNAYIISHKKEGEKRVYYYAATAPKSKNSKLTENQQYYYTWKNAKLVNKKVNKHSVKDLNLENGFWTASNYLALGSKYNKNGFRMQGSNDGRFVDFRYMPYQPDNDIMATYENVGGKLMQYGIWQAVLDKRRNYRDVDNMIRKLTSYEAAIYDKSLRRFQTALKKRFTNVEDRNELIDKIVNFTNMNNRVSYDEETGAITIPNGYFHGIKENYSPHMFTIGTQLKMLQKAITTISSRLENEELTKDEEKELKENVSEFMNMYDALTSKRSYSDEEDYAEGSRLTFGQRTVMTKHRSKWTNPMLRRKDAAVDTDYFDSLFRSLHTNILMANMFDTISKLAAISEINNKQDFFSSGHIDYIINATKNVLGDPTVKNAFDSIDKLEEWIGFVMNNDKDVVHNRETAIAMSKQIKAHMSAILLRSGGALYNRTQGMNDIIHIGLKNFMDAYNELEGEEGDKWRAIARHFGVTESINAFADLIGPTIGFDIKNAGYVMSPKIGFFGLFPALPTTTFIDFMKMKRWEFVTKGDKYIDRALNSIRYRNKLEKKLGKLLRREERRLHGEQERMKLEELRGAFYDLMHLPEKGKLSKDLLQKQIKRLVGDVSEQRLKKMVGWTLSAWMFSAGKKLFTFTEGERVMRTADVVMALKLADMQGLLGAPSKEKMSLEYVDEHGNARLVHGIDKRFLTPRAIRIARSMVHINEFLMNRQAMGLAFAGIGDSIFQYKQYPLQQSIHDYNVMKSLVSSSTYAGESLVRITKEATSIILNRGKKYDPGSPNIDHQARSALRFILTRFMASVLGTMSEYIPLVRTLSYRSGGAFFLNTIRGGENPVLHLASRMLAYTFAFGILSGSDDDRMRRSTEALLWSIARIFLPVWISMPAFYITRGIEWSLE